jgi:hypothetical protein
MSAGCILVLDQAEDELQLRRRHVLGVLGDVRRVHRLEALGEDAEGLLVQQAPHLHPLPAGPGVAVGAGGERLPVDAGLGDEFAHLLRRGAHAIPRRIETS